MSYTIMIIDDERMILDMLRDQFEMEQYQVITACPQASYTVRLLNPGGQK